MDIITRFTRIATAAATAALAVVLVAGCESSGLGQSPSPAAGTAQTAHHHRHRHHTHKQHRRAHRQRPARNQHSRPQPEVRVAAQRTSLRSGSAARFAGHVSFARPGRVVALQVHSWSGWATVDRDRVDRRGHFRLSVKPRHFGPARYRVVLRGAGSAASRAVRIHVHRPAPVPVATKPTHTPRPAQTSCTPGYNPCVPVAYDVDCAGGSGDGPAYVEGPVYVTGSDPYELDYDHDGVACES